MSNNFNGDAAGIRGEGLTAGEGVEFLIRNRYRLLLSPLIAAAVAVGVAYSLPKQWQARTVLQVGQLFYTTSNEQQQIAQIEAPARVVERVRLENFQDAVLGRLKLPTEPNENAETELIRNSISARLIRNAELVEISVRGFSPEQAKKAVEGYQQELIEVHAKLAQPSLKRIAEDRAQVSKALQVAEARKQSLAQVADSRTKDGAKGQFSEAVLLNQLIDQNVGELRDLQRRSAYLEEQASPERTFNTRPIGDIEVSRRAVWPRKVNFLVVGGALGLAFGLIWSLLTERKIRARRQQ